MHQRGQASVEWIALLYVVVSALVVVGVTAAHVLPLGLGNAAHRRTTRPDSVTEAYGGDTATLVRRSAPGLVYESGLLDAPVDPRACRVVACAQNAKPVLFTHVIHRGPVTYVQYWEYYPDSAWHGIAGKHADDWESVQIRVNADGTTDARASAHHGYTGERIGPDLNLNQVNSNWVPERWRWGWTRWTGWLRVARHSHAGFVTAASGDGRFNPAGEVELIPLETTRLPQAYAITPPWRKAVYTDPESPAT